ncbi:hypothetical protein Dimus_031785, partial [Dionaea muscipula]
MVFKRRSDEGRANFDGMETIEADEIILPWMSDRGCLLLALIDSTVLRSMGEALRHSLLTYRSTLQGIAKLQ